MRGRRPSGPRVVAIVVVAVVAGTSFALGYFVGKTAGSSMVVEAPAQFMTMPEAEKIPAVEKAASTQPPEEPERGVSGKKGGETERAAEADNIYCIQAGAFRDPLEAESLQAKLKALGYNAYIKVARKTPHGNIFRVRVGRFENRKEAQVQSLKLKKSAGLETFVTGLD